MPVELALKRLHHSLRLVTDCGWPDIRARLTGTDAYGWVSHGYGPGRIPPTDRLHVPGLVGLHPSAS
jgi:hypothetical protein